jgi:hypothetical protein
VSQDVPLTNLFDFVFHFLCAIRARRTTAGVSLQVSANVRSAIVPGMAYAANHAFAVAARTSVGDSVRSPSVLAKAPESKPVAPAGVKVDLTPAQTGFSVDWAAPCPANGVLLSYTVTYTALATGVRQTHQVPADATAKTLQRLVVPELLKGNYSVVVTAGTAVGSSPPSSAWLINVPRSADGLSSPSTSGAGGGGGLAVSAVVGISVGSVLVLALGIFILLACRRQSGAGADLALQLRNMRAGVAELTSKVQVGSRVGLSCGLG